MSTAAELRALADQLDEIEAAEAAVAAARAAYRADPSDPELKAAHRAASTALADLRQDRRATKVVAVGAGGTVIMPPAVAVGTGASTPDVEG